MVKLFRVGGTVRDEILGLRSKDIDFACEAEDYGAMVRWIREQGEVYLEQPEYLRVRAHLPGKPPADFVLCRREGPYLDGRRPSSVAPGTIHDDLARRDFTMNAIAVAEDTGETLDPFGGRNDIRARLIRCVGDSRDRFHEDALRLLRAVRFAITRGFRLHEDILRCLEEPALAERLRDNVSEDRKREELERCFAANTPETLHYLSQFPQLCTACFPPGGRIWLRPTTREV
jgi:tRNA nucleotidyltransferase (CCA-adding enzyme)